MDWMMISVYFIFDVNKHFLSTYSVPGTVLGSGGTGVNKTKHVPLWKSHSGGENIQKADKQNDILSVSSVTTMKTY